MANCTTETTITLELSEDEANTLFALVAASRGEGEAEGPLEEIYSVLDAAGAHDAGFQVTWDEDTCDVVVR